MTSLPESKVASQREMRMGWPFVTVVLVIRFHFGPGFKQNKDVFSISQQHRKPSLSIAEKVFQGSLYLLLVTGFCALASTGKLDVVSVALVALALLLRGYHLLKGKIVVIPERWTSIFTLLYFFFYALDYFLLSQSFVSATVHMVLFIMVIMGVIVLFAVVNTMTMNVVERTNEIGTIRAMGVRRGGIRRQFVVEGAMLGMIGATLGLVLAAVVAAVVNHAGLTWNPPASVNFIPLRLELFGRPALIIGTWLGLVLVATIAALIPANRAAKLPVVDALRHV